LRFSLDWIGDYVDVAAAGGPAGVHAALNMAGIEVGAIEPAGGDTALDADVTPNRPDAMSHRGIARDLAAARAIPFTADLPRHVPPREEGEPVEALARLTVEAPERCRRFGLRVVRGTRAESSDEGLQRRFRVIGLSPINALVDATNFSLWDIGQPLHAFDADRVRGRHLIVRLARAGERLVLLDGTEIMLDPDDVVVADEDRALSLAGVMGGLESAISESTTDVLLEAAWWDPASIRRTARRHGLHTDASHRFERGADAEAIPTGLAIAARQILGAAGGRLAPGLLEARSRGTAPKHVSLRLSRLRGLIGEPSLTLDRAAEILVRLGFSVAEGGEGRIEAAVPSWRPDVALEEDLIEEVARIHGYDRIPSALPDAGALRPRFLESPDPAGHRSGREIEDRACDAAREAGLFEAVSYPFSPGEAWEAPFGNLLEADPFAGEPLRIANPLDQGRPWLRRLVLPGLLESASRNFRNGARSIALFEAGRVWDRDGRGGDAPAYEGRHLAFVLAGDAAESWDRPARPYDVFDARGILDRILGTFPETGGPDAFGYEPAQAPAFARGAALEARSPGGRRVAAAGRLAEAVQDQHRLPQSTVAGEIDLQALAARRGATEFRPFSEYPAVDIDVTIAHRADLAWSRMEAEIRRANLANLVELRYANRFSGGTVEPGWVKSTISLRFRSMERTLSQEEVLAERERLVSILRRTFEVRA
jgi:phenylalanyl-tRNA synthetase beta chain